MTCLTGIFGCLILTKHEKYPGTLTESEREQLEAIIVNARRIVKRAYALLPTKISPVGSRMSKSKKLTTTPRVKARRLGLSLAYDIITKGHGGRLSVESTEYEYTEFSVGLPTAPLGVQ